MQFLWLLPTLAMSFMFASRNNSSPIFLVTILAVAIQLFVMLKKANTVSDAPVQVAISGNQIWFGERRLPRSSKLWSPSARKAVYQYITSIPNGVAAERLLAQARERSFAAVSSSSMSVWLGMQQEADLELDLASAPHLLVIGPTGSGKSQLLRLMLTSLTAKNTVSTLQLAIVDFKGSAMTIGLNVDHLVASKIDDLQTHAQADFWIWLEQQLAERERVLQQASCSEWNQLQNQSARLLVIVDEAAAALRSSVAAPTALAAVAARGRSLGIHLVLTNQGTSGLPRELMLNLRIRIALEATDQVELVQLGGSARKIVRASQGWVSARIITQSGEDQDFSFPLGET